MGFWPGTSRPKRARPVQHGLAQPGPQARVQPGSASGGLSEGKMHTLKTSIGDYINTYKSHVGQSCSMCLRSNITVSISCVCVCLRGWVCLCVCSCVRGCDRWVCAGVHAGVNVGAGVGVRAGVNVGAGVGVGVCVYVCSGKRMCRCRCKGMCKCKCRCMCKCRCRCRCVGRCVCSGVGVFGLSHPRLGARSIEYGRHETGGQRT
jgi:hypothetical protein